MSIQVTHIKPEFIDERGFISRVIDQDVYKIRSVLYISRKAGSIGANHYHKKDAHYIFCLKGKIKYSEKDMSKPNSSVESVVLRKGDLVFSKPMIAHATEFLTDTIFIAISTENRDQKKYEQDTVRLKLK